jgi:hypothetical protein
MSFHGHSWNRIIFFAWAIPPSASAIASCVSRSLLAIVVAIMPRLVSPIPRMVSVMSPKSAKINEAPRSERRRAAYQGRGRYLALIRAS